jgi:hypothetical protein
MVTENPKPFSNEYECARVPVSAVDYVGLLNAMNAQGFTVFQMIDGDDGPWVIFRNSMTAIEQNHEAYLDKIKPFLTAEIDRMLKETSKQ